MNGGFFYCFIRIRTSAKLQSVDPVIPGMDLEGFHNDFYSHQNPPGAENSKNKTQTSSSKSPTADNVTAAASQDNKSINSVDSGVGAESSSSTAGSSSIEGASGVQNRQRLTYVDCDTAKSSSEYCDTLLHYNG